MFAGVAGRATGRQPWHIDVAKDGDQLSAILTSCTGVGGAGSRIHYAHSRDGGLNWSVGGFLFPLAYEFEGKLQYRASLRPIQDGGHDYELWYSAASLSNMFSIAYLRMTRAGDTLIPFVPRQKPTVAIAKAAAD